MLAKNNQGGIEMGQTASTRMLTINEAAERAPGLSKWRIREMCISGELPHLKAGKKYLINEQVLIGYLTKGMREFASVEQSVAK